MGDVDSDGILNSQDKCENTPPNTIVNNAGCPDDADGVANTDDNCPDTPKLAPVNESGCAMDSDGDGVADYQDKCMNTPSGVTVNEDGCAKCGELLATVDSVHFDFRKAEIRPDVTNTLSKVARAITSTETRVRVEGHTDNIGTDEYNIELSEKRAKAVSNYLIDRGQVSAEHIAAVIGKGERFPIASNKTEEGRERNRRVEIIADCRAND
jgi:OOP family OmpA-OmpF porin